MKPMVIPSNADFMPIRSADMDIRSGRYRQITFPTSDIYRPDMKPMVIPRNADFMPIRSADMDNRSARCC